MPVTRGKKKTKRERRRFGSSVSMMQDSAPTQAPPKGARPLWRRGWQGPPWLNLTFGLVMLGGGFVVLITSHAVIFTVLYWLLGGFYLFRYYRQSQEKRSS